MTQTLLNNDFLSKDPREAEGRPNTIVMHPDFRMLVLANRPGFPFLGNDFFGALGTVDTFTPHTPTAIHLRIPKPMSMHILYQEWTELW